MSDPVFLKEFENDAEAIKALWQGGYSTATILQLLELHFGVILSRRQLCYRLKKLKLNRTSRASYHEVHNAIQIELNSSGAKLGYRSMWRRLKRKYCLNVSRQTVAETLKTLDPDGVEARSKKRFKRGVYRSAGPNQTWHLDGYDKLKPYGVCISGCIDGYSRKIIWAKAASTNSDPAVIAHYYLNCVEQLKGCPLQLRGDPGNENGTVAAMQVFLLQSAFDQYEWESSFLYGKSTSNQRIECFWSQLLKSWTEWWRQYFIAMEREGLFTLRHNLHKCLVRYCYLGVIQAELDEVINQWNDHPLRQQRQLEVPCGIPNILYYSPELTGGTDMLQPFGEDTSNLHQYTSFPSYIGDDGLEELLDDIMTNEGLLPPRTSREAKQLYQTLKEICENTL